MLRIDLHCHLIPGIDDGSRNLTESLLMGRALFESGVADAFVTPHQFRFDNALERTWVEQQVEALRVAFRDAAIGMRLHASAETYFGERLFDSLRRGEELLTFDGTPAGFGTASLLVELPTRGGPIVGVERMAELLEGRGVMPLMAHPERALPGVGSVPTALEWKDAGWRFQLDLLSLVGAYGKNAQVASRELLAEGLYDGVGSDLHRVSQIDSLLRARAEFARSAPDDDDRLDDEESRS